MLDEKKAIIFNLSKKNFYSLTPLIATIDNDNELKPLKLFIESNVNAQTIKNYLNKFDEITVAFSFRTAQLEEMYLKMKEIFENLSPSELKRTIFISGGSHPTGDPLSALKLGFDFAFIGEAELSLSLFLKKWLNNETLEETQGIAFLSENENLIRTSPPPLINLDDYPFVSMKRGLYPPLEITRGCAFSCTFCQVPSMFNKKVRHRSPDIILRTVSFMGARGLDDIRFITPNSFSYGSRSAKRVNLEAIEYLIKGIYNTKGIKRVFYGTFPGEVRPETVNHEVFQRIKDYIANKKIAIGLQSGSNTVLKKVRRGHTVEEGIKAIEIIVEEGFVPVVDFIFGLPVATDSDEQESLEVMKMLADMNVRIRAHVFMPLPSTPLENAPVGHVSPNIRKQLGQLNKMGIIEGNWSNQENYARKAWLTIQKIKNAPILKKTHL